MSLRQILNVSYRIIFCLLFIWFKGASAENFSDYPSTFGTPYHDKERNHAIDKSSAHIPPSGKAGFAETSFFGIAKSSYRLLSSVNVNAIRFALDIPGRKSKNGWNESEITFQGMQELSLDAMAVDRYKKNRKEDMYAGYASPAPDTETWLMILVGITLIGLQVIRGNKKAEPIYSSLH
ncbi:MULTISPECIES: hypothetical protein [Methylocaldum]|jgi:hypothetical protein|uniref:hypothetical protein n=1 Tax=unclassified Methylocaldum TaxID=2622260 RepID=UPI00117CDDDB|nr:hypothetical protein [Methylocaldum sp. 14B]MVF21095.1 hypothetical protein [Methylocaldum sp. BRCS4]